MDVGCLARGQFTALSTFRIVGADAHNGTTSFSREVNRPNISLSRAGELVNGTHVSPPPATALPTAFVPPPTAVFGFTTGLVNVKRSRGEKKPIPEEQKDERYFERRKRNNQAAKKSRDARRMREDQIAFRASFLEQENAVLRAQILTLREETHSLRQLLLLQRKSSSASSYIYLPTRSSSRITAT